MANKNSVKATDYYAIQERKTEALFLWIIPTELSNAVIY